MRRLFLGNSSMLAMMASLFCVVQPQTATAQITGTPSKFCHVTDGAFTACPGGGQEWSDVPVLSFPQTQAFLYADQANLDPTLTSPNNTLTLMYDECGRIKPLGPNEMLKVDSPERLPFGPQSISTWPWRFVASITIVKPQSPTPHRPRGSKSTLSRRPRILRLQRGSARR